VDCFRLNAAHLEPEQIGALVNWCARLRRPSVAPSRLLRPCGPEAACRKAGAPVSLRDGEEVSVGGNASGADVVVEGMDPVLECPPGCRVLVHDGKVVLRVTAVAGATVRASVERGGNVAGGWA